MKEKILVNNKDPDITEDSITSLVTLRENGIPECSLIANNDEGKMYLSTLNNNDQITVRYAYDEDNPDWDTLEPIFVGRVIELIPSLTKSGEIISVTAAGELYGSKQMRVAQEYGIQSGWGLTKLREIITDDDYGIINRYVEKYLKEGGLDDSGYKINTDYVYDDTLEYLFLRFPYQDAFMCLQDLIRIGSSLEYINNPSDWRGLHWIEKPYYDDVLEKWASRLVIAPVGNHNVEGIDGEHIIEDIWGTYAKDIDGESLDGSTDAKALRVAVDMVTQTFRTEIPQANYVLVAGKFEYPPNDIWTESLDDWHLFRIGGGGDGNLDDHISLVEGIVGNAVRFDCPIIYGTGTFYGYRTVDIKLNKLLTREGSLLFLFNYNEMVDTDGTITDRKFMLCKDVNNYFEYSFVNDETESWEDYGVRLTWKEYNAMMNGHGNSFGWTKVGTLTLADVNWVAWKFTTDKSSVFIIDDVCLSGNIIRGAYDSTSIEGDEDRSLPAYGCRMLTIKDSLAYTDTLSEDDTSPLAQTAIYELLRNRLVRTTGQIQIPLNPNILAGQLVHIHAVDRNLPDSDWHYKKEILVTGSSADDVEDYPLLITVDYNGKCKIDFGDIRFKDSEGNSIDYYMSEKVDGDYAKFWFKVTIEKDASKTYYMYYGNPSAVYDGETESNFFYVKDYVQNIGNAGMWGNRAYYSAINEVKGPSYLSKLVWFKMSSDIIASGCKILSYEKVNGKWHTKYKSISFSLVDENQYKYTDPDLMILVEADDYIGYYLSSGANGAKTINIKDPASYATTSGEPTVCEETTENYYTGGWWVNCGGCFRKYIDPEPTFELGIEIDIARYAINRDFRITEVIHSFATGGAFTRLALIDDLVNSIPLDTQDPYTQIIRATNPDYQTRTYGSLKVGGGDFSIWSIVILKDYPS